MHKATIIPRGRALGMVMRLPERDMLSYTRAKLKADIAVAMGGRVAEELVFGYEKVTSGASSDIKMATMLARAMVTQYGMSRQARAARLRRQRGRGVPRPLDRADAEPVRRDRRPLSMRRSIASSMSATRPRARSSTRISTICTRSRAGCSNTRRCPATRSKTCSRASLRCANSRPMSRRVRHRPLPFRPPAAARRRRPEPDTGGMEPQPST